MTSVKSFLFLSSSFWYIDFVLNFFADLFFNGRLGQFGEIRVEYNQSGHLSLIKVLSPRGGQAKFLRFLSFFFRQLSAGYKKGFAKLCAAGGARSASYREADTSLLVEIYEKVRTEFQSC